jgi:predicted GTPase
MSRFKWNIYTMNKGNILPGIVGRSLISFGGRVVPEPFNGSDLDVVVRQVARTLTEAPPTIGVVGVSGTGKSSTINAMFKSNLRVGHAVATTKEFRDVNLSIRVPEGRKLPFGFKPSPETVYLRVVDAPGLGEDNSRDRDYLAMYNKNLGRCDVILWVMTARNRAIALDQEYLSFLRKFTGKIVFGVNQIDLVEPMDWNNRINAPSSEQDRYIEEITHDRSERLSRTLGRPVRVLPYSSKKRWGLQGLFTELVAAAPRERAWIFSLIKGFDTYDFLPSDVRDRVIDIIGPL